MNLLIICFQFQQCWLLLKCCGHRVHKVRSGFLLRIGGQFSLLGVLPGVLHEYSRAVGVHRMFGGLLMHVHGAIAMCGGYVRGSALHNVHALRQRHVHAQCENVSVHRLSRGLCLLVYHPSSMRYRQLFRRGSHDLYYVQCRFILHKHHPGTRYVH